MSARKETEGLSVGACESGAVHKSAKSARCDTVLWLKALDKYENSNMPNINKVAMSMAALRPKLNEISQGKFGKKSLRVD